MPKSVKCIGYFDGEERNTFFNCKKMKAFYYAGSKNDFNKIYRYSLEYHGDYLKEPYYNNSLERVIKNGIGKNFKVYYNAKF